MAQATPAPIIYVVDDDTDVLGSLRFLLETDGFNVRTFRNGAALLNAELLVARGALKPASDRPAAATTLQR